MHPWLLLMLLFVLIVRYMLIHAFMHALVHASTANLMRILNANMKSNGRPHAPVHEAMANNTAATAASKTNAIASTCIPPFRKEQFVILIKIEINVLKIFLN